MKHLFLFLFLSLFIFSCKTDKKPISKKSIPYAIVLHGGAGNITPENLSTEKQKKYKIILENALDAGYFILENNGSALDAIQKTISVLEDSPLFNAGKGSVFDNQGKNKMDASIMDGKTLNAGAIAGVSNIKNPIFLAKTVLDKTKYVLLSGKGAEIFAEHNNIKFENDAYFYTKRQADYLLKVQKKERNINILSSVNNSKNSNINNKSVVLSIHNITSLHKYGTVGAVALDKFGNIAAGTSTGGLTNKKYGRIGDSPLIGAGTYANNKTCGISCTGVGEYFIRTLAAHEASNLIQYKNNSPKEAIKEVIHNQIANLGGQGGMIILDNQGNIAWDFNTKGMFRASKKSTGEKEIAFFKN